MDNKNEWKKVKLGDIVTITMGQSPKSEFYNLKGDGVPFLQGNRTFGEKFPVFDTYTTKITKMAKKNDVIMSVRAPIGDINITPKDVCLGRGICSLRMDNGNQEFLFYLMKYNMAQLINRGNGTVFDSINKEGIANLDISIPKNEIIQRKIAKILSDIGSKIEINNKINDNLENLLLNFFKQNIIKYSKNIKNGIIENYCDVRSGFTFKNSDWKLSGIKVIKIKNIENDTINFSNCSFVSEKNFIKAKEFIVKGGDFLIAMTGATIGKIAIVPFAEKNFLVNQRVGKFFLGETPIKKLPFIYCTLKQKDILAEIVNKGQGSAQSNISNSDILTTPCYIPEKEIILNFNKLCKPYIEKLLYNQYQNFKLENLKNYLLPKLMNGEIDVENIKL